MSKRIMGLNKTLKGWVNIPVEEKEIIKKCLNDFKYFLKSFGS